ncbi:hypothetical protein [Hymenobacter rubripertinctus]|uniref:Uncharacterized protein n=1 Tax=Hymenobacter rubripertinctus TaxID=2029981 RepID=A0A418R0C2_9BACT|nr:hypothetical protein [Hymenobacter rubripertinctus]RIY10835.1 hypothetical protein D0T11_09245 [Hymenobacter rubripertinctus]
MNVPTFDFSALTTRAACDKALVPTRRLQNRLEKDEVVLGFNEEEGEIRAGIAQQQFARADRSLQNVNEALTELPAGPSTEREKLEAEQATLVARKKNLALQGASGDQSSLQDLAEARNAAELEMVSGYLTQLEAHRLTLPA